MATPTYCPPTVLLIAELVETMAIRSLEGTSATPCSSALFASERPIPKMHLCDALPMIYCGILYTTIHWRSSKSSLSTVLHAWRLAGSLRKQRDAASLFQSSLQIQLKNVVIVRIGKGLSRRQGLDMAVVYAKYRSAERTIAGYLILSDSTPKNKLYRCICIRIDQYNWLYISNHDDFNALIWLAGSLSITYARILAG